MVGGILLCFAPGASWAGLSSCGATTTNKTTTFTPSSNTTYSNYHFSSTSGPCITFTGQSNVIIKGSEIGPCGGTTGSTSNSDSSGIEFSGTNSNIQILDNYIHTDTTCTASGHEDTHDGILETASTVNTGLLIQGNIILSGENGISLVSASASGDQVIGNALINAVDTCNSGQANNIKDWSPDSQIQNNYLINCVNSGGGNGTGLDCTSVPSFPSATPEYSESVEDHMSIGITSGTVHAVVEDNYGIGGHSTSGSFFLACAGTGTNGARKIVFLNNTAIDVAGAAFTVNAGQGVMESNWAFDNNNSSNTNSTGADWDCNTSNGCENSDSNCYWAGNDNMAAAWQGSTNWGGLYCGTSPDYCTNSHIADNHGTWGSSAVTAFGLSSTSTPTQIESALATAPLIPPQPSTCIVTSSYTTF